MDFQGTFYGAIAGIAVMCWIVFGAQYYIAKGAVFTPRLPLSTAGCDFPVDILNAT